MSLRNLHRVLNQTHKGCIKPSWSQNRNKLDHKLMFDEEEFLLAKSLYCRNNPLFFCNYEFAELASIVMSENNLDMPMNVEEAEMLYLDLVYHTSQI